MKQAREDVRLGRLLCRILRHQPQVIGIRLDGKGWADVAELLAGVNRSGQIMDMETLERIVREDNKQRYSFNADHTKLRANQGHSIPVDVELKKAQPPSVLYHGTGEKLVPLILEQGVRKMGRLYVHLSRDVPTALTVGGRHGRPMVLRVDAAAMVRDGFEFCRSKNGVWLCDHVPPQYLTPVQENTTNNRSDGSMNCKSIAIDGPAGAGKSTLARQLARELGYLYVDTGAIYRTVALKTVRAGMDAADADRVSSLLESLDIRMDYGPDGEQRMFLDGEDVSTAIREHQVSGLASKVAAIPAVRAFLLDFQRKQAREHNVVMDGRDIGTVVLPDAGVKIFLTAAPEARAKRRFLELEQRGQQADFDTILRDIVLRDEQDRNRAIAPLRQAEDAALVDTTELNLAESLQAMLSLVKEKIDL